MAFPFLILVVAIMSILGPGLSNLYIAVGLVGWIPYARITRGETLATRNLEYVHAARTIGATTPRIMLRHVLPNVIAPGLVYVFTGMVLAILTGATLSFLGLGPQPPTPEWGAMIASGRQFLLIALVDDGAARFRAADRRRRAQPDRRRPGRQALSNLPVHWN